MADTTLLWGGLARAADDLGVSQRARSAADDKAMLRAAADLTRDLNTPDSKIYWTDLIGSAVLGYVALAIAMFAASTLR